MNKASESGMWPKISYGMGLLVVSAIFVMAYFLAHIEIKDLDLWLHLGAGKYITEHRHVPLNDIFSNSVGGEFWNNHEWLFQVLIYNIYNLGGVAGISALQITLVLVTLSLLFFMGYARERQGFSCLLLFAVCSVYQQRFTFRPDLFSLFFFSVYIFILARHINKRWTPYILLGVQVLWVNLHGFFIFGPVFIFLLLCSEWIKKGVRLPYEWNKVDVLTSQEYKKLLKIFICVLIGCVVNPQFIKGAIYPLGIIFSVFGDQSVFFDFIDELQRPITKATLFAGGEFIYYKILIVTSAISFIYNRRKINLNLLFLWIIFLFFSLKAARNVVYFAFIAYFVLAYNAAHVVVKNIFPVKFSDKKFLHITGAFIKFYMLFWVLTVTSNLYSSKYYDLKNYSYKNEFSGVSLRSFPNGAADFLIENNIKGNFFNDFNSGAYLIGRTFPNIKVFMDGRTELYGAEFFKGPYSKSWMKGDKDVLEANIRKYQLTGALLNSSTQQIPDKVLKYFYEHPDWTLVYFDFDAVIFLKDIPQNEMWIKRYGFRLEDWQSPAIDIFRLGDSRAKPVDNINRAYTLVSVDLMDLAEKEAEKALKISPYSADAFKILGKVYAKRKDYKRAYEYFRQVIVMLPNDKKTYYNLGLALLDLKEYQEAVRIYQKISGKWPQEAKAAFFLAKAQAHNREFKASLKALDRALYLDPKAVKDGQKIGDIFYEQKNYADAVVIYQKILASQKDSGQIHYKLAKSYKALGDKNLAKRHIASGLQAEPENAEYRKFLKSLN